MLTALLLAPGAWGLPLDGGGGDGGPPVRHRRVQPGLKLHQGAAAASRSYLLSRRQLLQDTGSGTAPLPAAEPPVAGPPFATGGSGSSNGTYDGLAQICGDRSACGVLLVALGLVALLIVGICVLGHLCSRRRQRRQTGDGEREAAGDLEAHGAVPSGLTTQPLTLADAECESVRAMPPDKQAELEVRPAAAGDEVWGSRQECSICLEGVPADSAGSWVLFPCHHGACRACVADLVRYNQRPDRRIIHCPLCRSLAIVPASLLPQEALALSAGAGAASGASRGQATAQALGDGSWRVFWIV